jgi:hypothetical protein
METVRNRNRKQSTQILSNINSFQNSPELYNLNFPSLQKSVSQKAPAWYSPHQSNHLSSKANAFESSANNSNCDLFSSAQCMDILNEFMEKLNRCQTKMDQIKVIAEITFKYIQSSENR